MGLPWNGSVFSGLNRNVVITGIVSLFMDMSSEMVYPIVPLFLANVLGADKSLIGLIEGIAEATASLLKVLSGWLSDRIGNRKWLMAFGYGLATLSRPILATAHSWHGVLGSRFTDRLGKGIRTAPRDAILAESTDSAHLGRAFGLHRGMDTLGAVVGPFLAFSLLAYFHNDYRLVFWLSMIPGLLAVLLIVFLIKETHKKTAAAPAFRLTFEHFSRRFFFFMAIAAVFALGNSSDAFLILKAQQTGIETAMIPIVYMTFNLVYAVSSFPAGMLADRFGKKRVILVGFVLFAVIYQGFAIAESVSMIWLLFAAYGVFMGFTEGIQKAYLATLIPEDLKATTFGLYNMVVGLAVLPASVIGGWLWEHFSSAATFHFGVVTSLAAAALFAIFIYKN